MKCRWCIWMSLAVLILLAGCRKNEFYILFSLPESVNLNFDAVYYADSPHGGLYMRGVAPLINGKCEYHGVTVYPTLVTFTNNTYKEPIVVYVERGEHIKVEGDTIVPYCWHFGGNKLNVALSEWRNENADALREGNKKEINRAIKSFVETHREDPVAAILLLTHFDKTEDEVGFAMLWSKLSGEAKNKKWSDMLSRADVSPGRSKLPAHIRSFAMRKFPSGIDTVSPADVEATLLVFHTGLPEESRKLVVSIKDLAEEFPDSSRRVIADICLDYDSVAWRSRLRGDTIKGVSRLWSPEGVANRDVMKMGVTRLPFYIVVTPGGDQVYRGMQEDSAFKAFRELLILKEE